MAAEEFSQGSQSKRAMLANQRKSAPKASTSRLANTSQHKQRQQVRSNEHVFLNEANCQQEDKNNAIAATKTTNQRKLIKKTSPSSQVQQRRASKNLQSYSNSNSNNNKKLNQRQHSIDKLTSNLDKQTTSQLANSELQVPPPPPPPPLPASLLQSHSLTSFMSLNCDQNQQQELQPDYENRIQIDVHPNITCNHIIQKDLLEQNINLNNNYCPQHQFDQMDPPHTCLLNQNLKYNNSSTNNNNNINHHYQKSTNPTTVSPFPDLTLNGAANVKHYSLMGVNGLACGSTGSIATATAAAAAKQDSQHLQTANCKQFSNNNNKLYTQSQSQSQSSLITQLEPRTTNSSTAQLHNPTTNNRANIKSNNHNYQHQHQHHNNSSSTTHAMTFKRKVNLKYIKTLIILLIAIDLAISVFVHQFALNDQITPLIWFKSIKMRFSLLNLLLSSVWYVILMGGILFDNYVILVISCCVDLLSFLVLLAFSLVHFTRRIDYSTVSLTSFLGLLFSIIILHVYLVLTGSLTGYLAMAVRRRNKQQTSGSRL